MINNINILLKTCEGINKKVNLAIPIHRPELSVRLFFYEVAYMIPNTIDKNRVIDLAIANILSNRILVENSDTLKSRNFKENYREYVIGKTEEAKFAKCLLILHDTAMVLIVNSEYSFLDRTYTEEEKWNQLPSCKTDIFRKYVKALREEIYKRNLFADTYKEFNIAEPLMDYSLEERESHKWK